MQNMKTEQVNEVKKLFKQASEFIRSINGEEELKPSESNKKNLKLVKTLKKYVDIVGIDYPLQAKVLHLRYFENQPVDKVTVRLYYSRSFILEKQKEALELITERFFNAKPGATNRGAEL